MSAAYVRAYYGVDYNVGDRLVMDGRPGVLVSFPGQYLGIRFDGEGELIPMEPYVGVRMYADVVAEVAPEVAQ